MTVFTTEFEPGHTVRVKNPYGSYLNEVGMEWGIVKMVREHQILVEFYSLKTIQGKLILTTPAMVEHFDPDEFKPGWYKLKNDLKAEYVYYVSPSDDGPLLYRYSYNTESGLMEDFRDHDFGPLKISTGLISGLVRMEFS